MKVTVELDPALALPAGKLTAKRLIAPGDAVVGEGAARTFELSLAPGAVEMLQLE